MKQNFGRLPDGRQAICIGLGMNIRRLPSRIWEQPLSAGWFRMPRAGRTISCWDTIPRRNIFRTPA